MPTFTRGKSEPFEGGGVAPGMAGHSTDRLLETVRSRYSSSPETSQPLLAALRGFLQSPDGASAGSMAPLAQAIHTLLVTGNVPSSLELDSRRGWRHAIASACAAEALASGTDGKIDPRLAVAGSLLQNAGQIALASAFPKGYARVLEAERATGDPICDIERGVFGVDHCVIGRRLADWWGLPASLRDCMWLHHHPGAALQDVTASASLVLLVSAASEMARHFGFDAIEASREMAAADALKEFEIASEAADSLADKMGLCVDRIEASLPRHAGNAGTQPDPAGESPDSVSPRLARAVDRLMLASDADVASVCRTLITALGDLFASERAIAFIVDVADATRIACCRSASSCVDWVSIPELAEQAATVAAEVASTGSPIVSSPTSCDLLVARLTPTAEEDAVGFAVRTQGHQVARLFAIVAGQELLGGVVFVEGESDTTRIAHPEAAWLATAGASAIRCARLRSEVMSHAESLVDLNRRFHSNDTSADATVVLQAMARMAAGAAHELNNPLAVIAGRAQLLRLDGGGDDLERHLEIIDEQARRASQIVSELLAFAKPEPPTPRSVNLKAWADGLRQHWQRVSMLRPDQIDVTISDAAATLFVDPVQLDEAGGAVMANAIESTTPENARLVVNSVSASSDDTIVVSFGDNGRGMTPDVLAHAFDPFFSHRPAGRGRGLGLSRAARLVEVNGGRMWIDSRPGHGTTVYVAVPSRPA